MPLVWGRDISRNLLSDPLLIEQAMIPPDKRDPQVMAEGLRRARVALEDAQARGTDCDSIFADPMFLDPAEGDYRVADDSPALALGFRNFPMDRFGVQTPRLKAKARHALDTPLDQDGERGPKPQAVSWLGATVKTVSESGEITAAGLCQASGVILLEVPPDSPAAHLGFLSLDVILTLDGGPIENTAELASSLRQAAGRPVTLAIRRRQQDARLAFSSLPELGTK